MEGSLSVSTAATWKVKGVARAHIRKMYVTNIHGMQRWERKVFYLTQFPPNII